MLVTEMMENGLLKKGISDIIPTKCYYCGTALEIDAVKTHLYCPNEVCPCLLANKLDKLAKILGVKGFGQEIFKDIVEAHGLKKLSDIFKVCTDKADVLTSKYGEIKNMQLAIDLLEARKVSLATAVKTLGLPRMDTTCDKLLGEYSSLDEFYADFEIGQEVFVSEKLSMSIGDNVWNVVLNLTKHKELIYEHVSMFNVKGVVNQKVQLAITGGVDGFGSKEVFVNHLNSVYGNKVNVLLGNSVTRETDALISESKAGSSKLKNAEKYNIPIMTSKEFIEFMASNYGD